MFSEKQSRISQLPVWMLQNVKSDMWPTTLSLFVKVGWWWCLIHFRVVIKIMFFYFLFVECFNIYRMFSYLCLIAMQWNRHDYLPFIEEGLHFWNSSASAQQGWVQAEVSWLCVCYSVFSMPAACFLYPSGETEIIQKCCEMMYR